MVFLGPAELACPSPFSLSNFNNQPFGLLIDKYRMLAVEHSSLDSLQTVASLAFTACSQFPENLRSGLGCKNTFLAS